MTRRLAGLLGWLGALLAAGCPPPAPPVIGPPSTTGTGADADARGGAGDGGTAAAGPEEPGACGVWVEQAERLYRRAPFAFLTAQPEYPGRVVVRAFVSDHYECGPCPRGYHCEPCGDRNVLRPFRGAPDTAAFTAFGAEAAGRCVDAFVALGPGYRHHAGTRIDADPREKSVWLEATAPVDDALCSAEAHAATAGTEAPPTEPCVTAFAPGAMVERTGESVALPTPELLDVAERLRRAELAFAAGRWDEARTAYYRVQRDARMDDLASWSYAEWRMAQCALRLGQAVPAVESLTSLLGRRPGADDRPVPGLREALVADLGRAFAALLQDPAEVETSLARTLEGDELLAALEAAEQAWSAAGLAAEARALRSAILRRQGPADDPSP